MSKEELLQGLRKNWYLIAALAVFAALAAVKLLMGSSETPSQTPGNVATTGTVTKLPSAQESLTVLQSATTPDEQAKARTQIEEYQQKLKAEPGAEDTPAYLMAMGNLYRQKLGDYAKAASCYERIIMEFPDSADRRQAFLQLEACYLTQKDRTGLKWLYNRMVEEFPEDAQEHLYAKEKLDEL